MRGVLERKCHRLRGNGSLRAHSGAPFAVSYPPRGGLQGEAPHDPSRSASNILQVNRSHSTSPFFEAPATRLTRIRLS